MPPPDAASAYHNLGGAGYMGVLRHLTGHIVPHDGGDGSAALLRIADVVLEPGPVRL